MKRRKWTMEVRIRDKDGNVTIIDPSKQEDGKVPKVAIQPRAVGNTTVKAEAPKEEVKPVTTEAHITPRAKVEIKVNEPEFAYATRSQVPVHPNDVIMFGNRDLVFVVDVIKNEDETSNHIVIRGIRINKIEEMPAGKKPLFGKQPTVKYGVVYYTDLASIENIPLVKDSYREKEEDLRANHDFMKKDVLSFIEFGSVEK